MRKTVQRCSNTSNNKVKHSNKIDIEKKFDTPIIFTTMNPLHVNLSRGPIILLLSTTVPFLRIIVIPVIQTVEINFEFVITVVLFIVGSYLTISDCVPYIQTKIAELHTQIKELASSIVLDTTLRNLFSFDCNEGLLGCTVGTFTGVVGLYTLPFTQDQRIRILQSFLPPDSDAKEIFFTPGGFWNFILPSSIPSLINANDNTVMIGGSTSFYEDGHDVELEHKKKERKELKKQIPYTSDLTWDDNTMVDNITIVESHGTGIETIIPNEDESMNAPFHSMTSGTSEMAYDKETLQEGNVIPTVTSGHAVKNNASSSTSLDPVQTLELIIKEFLCRILNATEKKVDERTLLHICLAASTTLLIQLKFSRTARNMVWSSIHIITTCSLISVISGSIGILKAKESLSKFLRSNKDCLYPNVLNSERIHRSASPKPRFKWKDIFCEISNSLQLGCHLNLEEGQNRKRRWRGIIAALVLCLLHRRRQNRCIEKY